MKNKKWELLKQAYDNYPKGTRFIGANSDEFISSGVFNIVNGHILEDNYGLVYNSDTKEWAEIIVSEKPKTEDKPKELEVGKWYRHKDGPLVFNIGTLDNHGYGFDSNGVFKHSTHWSFSSHPQNWTLATEQEVFEALKKEAVKRYIGKTPKCVHGCREIKHTNDLEFNWDGECLRSIKSGVGANCLFNEGKWAEIIEEVK